jgi:hypothetical protein
MSKLTNTEKQEKERIKLHQYIRDLKIEHLLSDKDIEELLKQALEGQIWLKEKL